MRPQAWTHWSEKNSGFDACAMVCCSASRHCKPRCSRLSSARPNCPERDQVRQDLIVREMQQETRQHLDEIEALWREGCNLAYNLMGMISAPNSGRTVLDDAHRAAVLALRNDVNKRLLHLRLLRTNEHWISYGEGSFPALAIIPARPREPLAIVDKSA